MSSDEDKVVFHAATIVKTCVFVFCMFFLVYPDPPIVPIGRPMAFLLGSTVLVMSRSITSKEAFESVDLGTLSFLLGMMIIVEVLEQQRALRPLGDLLQKFSSVLGMWAVLVITGIVSTMLTNDGTVILLTPFVVKLCKSKNIHPRPYLIALACAANVGSAATLTGNPQNVIIGLRGGLDWLQFFKLLAPAALLGLLINGVLLVIYYARTLRAGRTTTVFYSDATVGDELYTRVRIGQRPTDGDDRAPLINPTSQEDADEENDAHKSFDMSKPKPVRRVPEALEIAITTLLIVGLTVLYLIGEDVPFATVSVSLVVLVMRVMFTSGKLEASKLPMKALANVDWSLLLFFAGNFVVIEAFNSSNIPRVVFNWIAGLGGARNSIGELLLLCMVTIGLSNLVGNVPTVLMIAPSLDDSFRWMVVSWAATVAGNLTIAGSAANVFVDQLMRKHGHHEGLGFINHLKYGVPSTLITFGAGFALLYVLHHYAGFV